MPNLFVHEEKSLAPETEFFIATVADYDSANGCQIILPGEASATSKWYKTIYGGAEAGARVVVMKQSGTYIVIGPLSGEDTYCTTTLADIATAASGFTLLSGMYAQTGKTAMLLLKFRPTTAITTTQEFQIATLVAGKRPPFNAFANYWATNAGEILSGGGVYCYGTCTNTSGTYTLFSTYILA